MDNYERSKLDLAVDLINTWDPYLDEPEQLRGTEDLTRFLRKRHIDCSKAITEGDLAAVRRLRARLRRFAETDSETEAVQILNDLLRSAAVIPSLSWEGTFQLNIQADPDAPIADRLAVEAALALGFELQRHGKARLKICDARPCVEVFIDRSKNRSRRFCSTRCSNRYNVAVHRRRLQKRRGKGKDERSS
ncbi:CGNR zinc finger domain-containing protein [Planifilum fimeticola]